MEQYPKKILVADDEIHILHVVALKFRNAGYTVITARNGCEALELAQLELPDLIITDYQMPSLTGLEFSSQLRQNPLTCDIPVIMITARGFNLDPFTLQNAGVIHCMHKPFGPRELLCLVEDALEPVLV